MDNINHSRHPGLDTLRAAAILMVVPYHALTSLGYEFIGREISEVVRHGWAGVELFFVLSGFLIGTQLIRSLAQDGRVEFGRFYFKRSMRILPTYLTVLLLYYVWPSFREKPDIDPAWRFLLFVMNYGRENDAFSHAWSLCVEEHFYLIVPVLVAASAWRPNVFRPVWMIAVVLLGGIVLRFGLWANDAPFFISVYRPTHTHLDGLTVGVALALVRERRINLWERCVSRPWLLTFGGCALVCVGLWMYANLNLAASYSLTFTALAIGFGALLAAAMAPGFWLANRIVPGASTIAALAFALYLTHKQMINMATDWVENYKENRLLTVALAIVLMAVCAAILHFGVEKPFLRLRDRVLRDGRWVRKDSKLIS